MAGIKFANNVATTTTSAINAAVTTIPVASIAGFPTQTGGDYFYATLAPAVEYSTSVREIVKVTDWTTTSLTVTRAQDGTEAASWASGSKFEIRFPRVATEEFTTISSTATLTNKTINLTDNTVTGTIAEFNTACSDANFATLEGDETLTNKTLVAPILGTPASGDLSNCTGVPAHTGNVAFPAVQVPSSDANTLDDYEEGTFTATVTFATPGDLSVTYQQNGGTYTKIGRLVYIRLIIVIQAGAMTWTSASGSLRISGANIFDLIAETPLSGYVSGTMYTSNPTAADYIIPSIRSSSGSYIWFFGPGPGSALDTLSAVNLTSGGTLNITISGCCQTIA